jgi:hypothetical protein
VFSANPTVDFFAYLCKGNIPAGYFPSNPTGDFLPHYTGIHTLPMEISSQAPFNFVTAKIKVNICTSYHTADASRDRMCVNGAVDIKAFNLTSDPTSYETHWYSSTFQISQERAVSCER